MNRALEICLNKYLLNSPGLVGYVHSKFAHAVNLCFGRYLVTVHKEDIPGLPDDIVVDEEVFRRIEVFSNDSSVVLKRGWLYFQEGNFLVSLSDSRLRDASIKGSCNVYKPDLIAVLKPYTMESGLVRIDVAHREKVFSALRQLACSKCKKEFLQNLIEVSGYGVGLTPSSDDAALGIVAASYSGLIDKIELPSAMEVYAGLKDRTTAVSNKYLCCAVENRFSQPLIQFLSEKSKQRYTKDAAIQIAKIGATSGRDTLAGMMIAIKASEIALI